MKTPSAPSVVAVVAVVAVLAVLAVLSPQPLAAAGGSAGPLHPAIEPAPGACGTDLLEQAAAMEGALLDPLAGVRQASSCGTCSDQFRACKIECGCSPIGPPICVDTFTCDPADPCGAVCICRPL